MSHSQEDIKKQAKVYVGVFLALGVLTLLTVAVSYLHLPLIPAIVIALLIATFKGSLVAGFFMHLFHEKPLISWVLLLTIFFFFVLLILPSLR